MEQLNKERSKLREMPAPIEEEEGEGEVETPSKKTGIGELARPHGKQKIENMNQRKKQPQPGKACCVVF